MRCVFTSDVRILFLSQSSDILLLFYQNILVFVEWTKRLSLLFSAIRMNMFIWIGSDHVEVLWHLFPHTSKITFFFQLCCGHHIDNYQHLHKIISSCEHGYAYKNGTYLIVIDYDWHFFPITMTHFYGFAHNSNQRTQILLGTAAFLHEWKCVFLRQHIFMSSIFFFSFLNGKKYGHQIILH